MRNLWGFYLSLLCVTRQRAMSQQQRWNLLKSCQIPVYTIQPVVKLVWQPVISCIQNINRLSKRVWQPDWQPVELRTAVRSTRLLNRLDNRLYRVNGVLVFFWLSIEACATFCTPTLLHCAVVSVSHINSFHPCILVPLFHVSHFQSILKIFKFHKVVHTSTYVTREM